MRFAITTVLLLLGFLTATQAHDQIPGAPQSKPIAILQATIHTVDGPVIQSGGIVFVDGKITAVGKAVIVPADADQIDGSGMHVYPGLIEPMSDIGLREINAVDATNDRIEYGQRNPNASAVLAVNPDSELIPVARAGGVLVAMTAPAGRWIRGQSAVIQLDGWTADEMTLRAHAGLCVSWSAMEPRDDDEKKRIEKRTKKHADFDALLAEAKRYGEGRDQRPDQTPTDVRLESLVPLITGELPLIAEANDQHEIESAVAFAVRHQLKLIIFGGYDAAECSELLNHYDVPVIVGGVYRLPRRRHDAFDGAYTLPARLKQAGVKFCIGGHGSGAPGGAANARNLPYHAATAVAHGLEQEAGLRAITLASAEILGVADRIGSLTVDKDATLLITNGDIFETQTNVSQAWIQGRAVDLSSRHTMLYDKYRAKYENR